MRDRAEYARALEESVDKAVAVLSRLDEVRRISLFGSYAGGRRDLFTDLDILVLMDTAESFLDRLPRLYALLRLPVDLDLLCYTPREWKSLRDRPFFKEIRRREVVLYEKKDAVRSRTGSGGQVES